MDEFKPDNQPNTQNDLRPDTSDRPAGRSRPSSTAKPKLTISRQHIMIGVGVLVLLLLIIAISSALKLQLSMKSSKLIQRQTSVISICLALHRLAIIKAHQARHKR